ncbi:unnamed protein product [Rotaria socialis]|uniref:Kinesin light chain n=2 Tax=Rotaria socialis TaxID=392032 RepID=A0A817U9M0_9BILA|nr:unnamed protein product [Rotaria socialis]CAF4237805.1 unnamed protein product [Rotaria socialis]
MSRTNPNPTITTSTVSLNAIQPRRRTAQNYLVIWVDGNIDKNSEDCRNTLAQLRAVVSEVKLCTTPEYCVEFLNEMDEGKAFIISSGALGQSFVNNIHGMSKVNAIYIFCGNKARHELWAKEWQKIRGVFTSIKPICESLKEVAHECDHNSIPMNFVPKRCTPDAAFNEQKLNQLPPAYMYSVVFKDILLEIDDDDTKSMNTLVKFCQQQNIPDAEINEFKRKYHQKSSVWWYTCGNFLYCMLNRGLRSLDLEVMTKLGFFIRHLHRQLEQLHQKQLVNFQQIFTVYHGQGLSQQDFQNLVDMKDGLLPFNNFLSTNMKKNVALKIVELAMQENPYTVGVIFIMTIDPSKISTSSTPFAMIDECSASPEKKQILFTMHTVFRVVEIKQTPKNSRLWEVQLAITDERDSQLSALTNRTKEEIQGSNRWQRMCKLMLKVGHFDQAEKRYSELLENFANGSDRAHIYHQLGWLKNDQGKYEKAVKFYKKHLRIKRKTLSEDDASLANTYNSIAGVYDNMEEYSKALEFYQKSLKISEKTMPPNHPDLATSYSNIGLVYKKMDKYSKALSYLEKALIILRKSLPSTHPSIKNTMAGIEEVKKKL